MGAVAKLQPSVSAPHRSLSIVRRSALLQSTTSALYKCAKENIFHDHDLEKMFGHKQSCSWHALIRAGSGTISQTAARFSASKTRQGKHRKGDTSFMALARIITRSNPCSRELALDLLGRGYAVEIVSPDEIPDNLADLELRVEEDPGNQLVASVEAHNGERTASLEFLHYLKAPMPDFIRRPPEPEEAIHFPKQPVSINAEPSTEEVELSADAPQPAPTAVSQAASILPETKLDAEPEPKEGARLIVPRDPLPSLLSDPLNNVALASSLIAEPTTCLAAVHPDPVTAVPMTGLPGDDQSPLEPLSFDHFTEQFQSVALTLVSMALIIALIFGFGMHRSGKTAVQSSGAAQAASISRASIVPEKVSAVPASLPATNAGAHPANAPKESPVATIDNRTAKAPTDAPTTAVGNGVSRRHGDALIARDTVTYFDQRAFDEAASRATTSQRSAPRPISRKQDGVIAANSLNNNPSPKAAKPDSNIKRYSDLK